MMRVPGEQPHKAIPQGGLLLGKKKYIFELEHSFSNISSHSWTHIF